MFDYNNWVLCDYTEDDDEQYIHLNYNEKDINILIPHYILNTPVKKILTYNYESYMVDLFNSFSTYEEIINQAHVDLTRSISYINNRRIRNTDIHSRILNKMDLYQLTQKEKYSFLMILTQAVLAVPYYLICSLYPGYHVGELKYNENENENNKVINRIYIRHDIQKVKIMKYLRAFSIDNQSNDITYKVLQLKLLIDIKNMDITFLLRDKL